jgi:amino acid transporter
VLTLRDLTFFGIAAIIGCAVVLAVWARQFLKAGQELFFFLLFVLLPAVLLQCVTLNLQVAIPVAGSAYTYAYASFGELFAWVIGWALIMEYSIGTFT